MESRSSFDVPQGLVRASIARHKTFGRTAGSSRAPPRAEIGAIKNRQANAQRFFCV
jgi:hypothetical protein